MKKIIMGVVIGMLLGLSLPVLADHVLEPTAPITGVELRVYNYPHAATLLTACDGSETVSWNNVRIEPDVIAVAKPSEHFDGRIVFAKVLNPGRRETVRAVWDNEWKHSNLPPHTNTESLKWEASMGNNYELIPGTMYEISFRGHTLESQVFYETSCRFKVG